MERWLFSFFMGGIVALFMPTVPVVFCEFLLLLLILIGYLSHNHRSIICLLLGWLWINDAKTELFNQVAQPVVKKVLATHKAANAEIKVLSIAHRKKEQFAFKAQLLALDNVRLTKPILIRLTWHQPTFIPKLNDSLGLLVKIKRSRGLANLGGFDYQRWLISQSIMLTGYVKNSPHNEMIRYGDSMRDKWYRSMKEQLANHPLMPIYLALLFGERGEFTNQHWQVFSQTGTLHLVAISGLHIGLVAGFTFIAFAAASKMILSLGMLFGKKLSMGSHYLAISQLIFCLSMATFYAWLAGFSTPTIRALLFIVLIISGKLFAWHRSKIRFFLIALCLMTILQPLTLLSASFWLTFLAVACILITLWFFQQKLVMTNKILHYLSMLLVIQIGIAFLMLPINALLFGQVPILALAANIIAVPAISLVILPLILVSAVLFFTGSTELTHWVLALLDLLWQWLTWLSQLSSELSIDKYSLSSAIIFVLLLFILLTQSSYFKGMLAAIIASALSGTTWLAVTNKPANWQVDVLDVGQGLAVFIKQEQQVLLYDTGAKLRSGNSMAELVVLPYLKHHGISEIEHFIVSHSDNDHAGGVEEILANIIVNNIRYNAFIPSATPCIKGQSWQWHQLTIKVLSPLSASAKGNKNSCVLHVSDGKFSLLLTGDIPKQVEKRLINRQEHLAADILIAPHHGSKTSSSIEFIKKVNPDAVVFSTGYNNHWKMPNSIVLQRYKQLGVPTFNTATDGMISFKIFDSTIEYSRYRHDIYPYWFSN